jgi:hypothetical protein
MTHMNACLLMMMMGVASSAGLDIRNAWSPRNAERPRRPATRAIILHTTEGSGRGALAKLRRDGEAHYLVDERGRVHRIVAKDRVAFHAGTSMWDGVEDLDRSSIGIEVAGYHHRRLRPVQVSALRELLRQLQSVYGIPDRRVLTHSMVAYGRPNKYHRYRHRGRKRCGMLFADPDLRRRLGLDDAPRSDPDVKARRLRVADRVLFRKLFPPRPAPRPSQPSDAPAPVARAPRSSPSRWTLVDRPGASARSVVGASYDDATTIYLFPSGLVRTGRRLVRAGGRRLLSQLPRGTRILTGYQFGGYVTSRRAPSDIAGERWNDPGTLYRLPSGDLVPGHRIDASRLPRSTLVFPPA